MSIKIQRQERFDMKFEKIYFPIYCLEGLSGSGKTTVGKLLAEKCNGMYFHFGNDNLLMKYKNFFDKTPVFISYLYFLVLFCLTKKRAEQKAEKRVVFQDKSIAHYLALMIATRNLPKWILKLTCFGLINYFDKRFFLDLDDRIRRERMDKRGLVSLNDQRMVGNENKVKNIYKNYHKENLVIVDINNKNPDEIADEIWNLLKTRDEEK